MPFTATCAGAGCGAIIIHGETPHVVFGDRVLCSRCARAINLALADVHCWPTYVADQDKLDKATEDKRAEAIELVRKEGEARIAAARAERDRRIAAAKKAAIDVIRARRESAKAERDKQAEAKSAIDEARARDNAAAQAKEKRERETQAVSAADVATLEGETK